MVPLDGVIFFKGKNKNHSGNIKLLEWLSLEHRCKVRLFCAVLADIVMQIDIESIECSR